MGVFIHFKIKKQVKTLTTDIEEKKNNNRKRGHHFDLNTDPLL